MGYVVLADPPTISLPQCASASTCWISYVEKHTGTALTGKDSLLLSYEITGDNTSFVNDSPNNTCGGPPALSLLIHQIGDTGFAPSMRWFSQERQALAVGRVSWAVPLLLSKWINVNGQSTDQAGFDMALAAQGSIGLVFGGGCFAGHGVAVSAGDATLKIDGLTIQ